MPSCAFDAGVEGMLDQAHFGHGVGHLDQPCRGAAPGDHHMLARWPRGYGAEHLIQRDVVFHQHDVEFVQQHEVVARIGEHAARNVPGCLCGSDVERAVLGFPGEAFAHHVIIKQVRKTAEKRFFAGRKRALDELHHAAIQAMPQ